MTDNILPPDIENPEVEKQSRTSKNINKIISFALIVIAIGIGIMIYWGVQSDKVITLNKDPFPTRTIREHPTAGGVVFLTTDYCKSTSAVGELRTSFVSETREVFLPLSREATKKGCHNNELVILIPKDIEPDTYKIKLRLSYDINPLKRGVTQIFYSYPVIIDPTTVNNQLPLNTQIESGSRPVIRLNNISYCYN